MATKTVTIHCQEEQAHQMSHSMAMSSQIRKKAFKSRNEEASYSEFYPIIPGDLMSAKELLEIGSFPRHRTWEVLKHTMAEDEQRVRDKWTLFGNEAEKVEVEVIRNQRTVRTRADRLALRQQAERKAAAHMKFVEDLSLKPPDFPVPLRSHSVWEGMGVTLTCTVQGCPTPQVTWYKDGVPLCSSHQPWNYKLKQTYGLNCLEIRRTSVEDAGEYKAVAWSSLGEAMTFATLQVNSYKDGKAGLGLCQASSPVVEQEAHFEDTFPPTFITEGEPFTLHCGFSSPLLPFQQDVTWLKDGVPQCESSRVLLQTTLRSTSMTLKSVHKEQEGVYTVCLRTQEGIKEHSAYIYVRDGTAAMPGAPGSPLDVQCTDVNKDYVFLTWKPPSADGASAVRGYFVESCDISTGEWMRCSDSPQKECHFPVRGLKENTMYQFRVRAENQAGVGRPSRSSEPVLTSDPAEPGRIMVVKVHNGKEIVISKDQLEGEVRVPLPPTGVHACEVSDSYVVLHWTEPDPRGREPLTFYVEQSLAGQNSWHLASLDQIVASPRFVLFDLQKDKAYCFRVRSINKYGVSEPSLPSVPISLGDPQAPPQPPHAVQAFRDTDTSVLLLWKEPTVTGGILGYYLYCCEAGTDNWTTVNNKPTTGTRFTVHGLATGKKYVFRVKSVSQAGNSKYSEESTAIQVKSALCAPSRPSGIALLNCTGTEMVIGWRAPASNGGDPIRGYYLDQRDTTSTDWHEVNVKPSKERVYKVDSLLRGLCYQFRVFATNVIGLGKPSDPSEAFLCEPWTMAEPGCPYDLVLREVRRNSLVLLWEKPLYEGQSQVTGYLVEISTPGEVENWTAVTSGLTTDTHLRVSGLDAGKTYILRVSAVNGAGVGMPSLPSQPVTAQTKPGTKDVEIGVDSDGFIFLGLEAPRWVDGSQLLWSKNYREAIDAGRARVEATKNRSTLTFTSPTEEDLGLYTVELIENPDVSSSYQFTAEDLERMLELSWQIRNPLITLKTPWQVEVTQQGAVRLWLQTEPLTEDAELCLVFNDKEISSRPERKINFHKASGIVEILIDHLSPADEGSFTAQLRDGRAKNQFTLVFVDKKFHQTMTRAEANKRNWKRKSGPHFLEFLSWKVTEECEVIFRCKVTNVGKDTRLKWFKDGGEITEFVHDQQTGISTFTIAQATKKEAGVYKTVVSDIRGEDVSTLEMVDGEFEKLQQHLSKQCALSAGPIEVQSTAQGFRLCCSLKYYLSYLKTSWFFKEKRIDQQDRTRPGSSMHKVWIEIIGPTENDKGKYILEMFDGMETHKRTLDLSGQVFADAMLEYQRLKQVAVAEKNKARVTKGLPDVVAIMESKTLCLTCYAEGEPAPEMFWLKNDREIVSGGQYSIRHDHQCIALTIHGVSVEDSGLYSVLVRNKYGSQNVHVTVSVYKRGEKPRADAIEMS
ncbi:myomesin-3 [Scleropages formosus]|uniref:myomesin-3 n=1 Tax=Scleropages formosus TaxID=113540 RepID=UPI000878CADF|nr:myomesin-3 [Scleropages formosus]